MRIPLLLRFVLVLLTGLMLTACQNRALTEQRLDRFVEEVIFGGPIDGHLPKDDRIVKWSEAVLVAVLGTDTITYRPRVAAQVARISRISGLDVRMADAAHLANLKVTFVKTADFNINRENVPCFASVSNELDRIANAKVRISTANPELVDHCLSHELLHALGLLYHSGIVRSALSPAHRDAEITPWDELALRVLYDARLKAGAVRADAVPIMKEIVSELIAGS